MCGVQFAYPTSSLGLPLQLHCRWHITGRLCDLLSPVLLCLSHTLTHIDRHTNCCACHLLDLTLALHKERKPLTLKGRTPPFLASLYLQSPSVKWIRKRQEGTHSSV